MSMFCSEVWYSALPSCHNLLTSTYCHAWACIRSQHLAFDALHIVFIILVKIVYYECFTLDPQDHNTPSVSCSHLHVIFVRRLRTAFTRHHSLQIPSVALRAQQTTMPEHRVYCRLPLNSDAAKLIKLAKICIWDEAPMMHRNTFDAVDKSFRDIMKQISPTLEKVPFESKIMVFGGDFRQVAPVIRRASRAVIGAASLRLFHSICPHMQQMQQHRLNIKKRVDNMGEHDKAEHLAFVALLLEVGDERICISRIR